MWLRLRLGLIICLLFSCSFFLCHRGSCCFFLCLLRRRRRCILLLLPLLFSCSGFLGSLLLLLLRLQPRRLSFCLRCCYRLFLSGLLLLCRGLY